MLLSSADINVLVSGPICTTPRFDVRVDCAICADGYAPGVAYSCHECSGGGSRWALGFTIFLSLVMVVMARLLFSHLRSVAQERTEEDTDVARGFWRQKYWYCQTFLVKMLPLTAIKIVITVWQIISQVCKTHR